MRNGTIQRIEKAFEKLLNRLGEDGYRAMSAAWQQASGKPLLSRKRAKSLFSLGFREGLRRSPEPEPEQLSTVINLVENAPHALRHMLQEAARELPHGGGRPRKLDTPEKRAKLCARIAELLPECEDPRFAFLRAAAESRPPISERTARRVWTEHQKANKQETRKKTVKRTA